MTLLLDTPVLLWTLARPDALGEETRRRITHPSTVVLVSAASAWEIEIKRALGKLEAPDDLEEQMRRHRFNEMPVRIRHTRALRGLPPLHRDPFDRILVAQALVEDVVLVTRDDRLRAYQVKTLPA